MVEHNNNAEVIDNYLVVTGNNVTLLTMTAIYIVDLGVMVHKFFQHITTVLFIGRCYYLQNCLNIC